MAQPADHQPVGSDGMDAKRPGLSASGCMQPDAVKSNHADIFYPILLTRAYSNNAPTHLEFVTRREWALIRNQKGVETKLLDDGIMTYTGNNLEDSRRFQRVILYDFTNIDTVIEAVAHQGAWGAHFRMPQ